MQPLQCRCYLRRKARRAGSGGFDRGSVVHGVKVIGGSVFNCNTQSFLSVQDRRVMRAGVTLKGLLHSPVRGLYQRPFSGRAPWFVSSIAVEQTHKVLLTVSLTRDARFSWRDGGGGVVGSEQFYSTR